ncbi:protein zerknuellt 1-like [Pieris rapae]|uniref:protein zerknuellt 1-like n=1 Tax=Pieris rapae TaxID=64459 RepID=UPI001E27B59A|nr:protein zerknuellt 1-like [Pieris rapae]
MGLDTKCNSAANIHNTEIQKLVSSTQSYISRNAKKSRRLRSSFTTEQLNYLESEFKKFPYIGNVNRQELSKNLNLPERAIKIWFQNRRMKEKKESNKEEEINQCVSIKITNNQLNNVHNLQSANDEINVSTPLQVGCNEAKYVAITSSIIDNTPINYAVKDSREQEITTTTETINTGKINHNDVLPYNDHKMEKKNPSKSNDLKVENVTTPFKSIANDDESRKRNTSPCSSQSQDMPEDLSRKSKTKSSNELKTQHLYTESGSVSVYMPNCYTPSYVPGNVLWNPNMGIITNGAVPTYPPSSYIINQQSLRKSNCNCDCHLPLVPQVTENPGPYIPVFTIPYTAHLQ